VKIEGDTVLNLIEGLTQEYSWKQILGHFGHENIGFIVFVDSCNNYEFAEILVLSQTLLENTLTANNVDFTNVGHVR
jgi:hypothetical protein